MRNSRRGSSTVFVLMILSAMMAIVMAFFMGARNEYIKSRADAAINISGDSLMSMYNSYVMEEYGLFVLEGKKSSLVSGLRSYLDFSMSGMEGVRVSKVNVTCGSYSLTDVNVVRSQIVAHMKFAAAMEIMDSVMKQAEDDNDMISETLRNKETIVSLPSYGMKSTSLSLSAGRIAKNPENIENVFSENAEDYLINRYILRYFNNNVHMASDQHFFRNEAEYILGGKLSDRENEKAVENGLKALRFPLNLQHVLSDPDKMKKLLAAAEILAPEAAAAAQLALASAWAYTESDNDVKLLMDGHKVPVIKDKTTWAMSLDNVIEGITGGTVMPDKEKGYDYEKYLQCFLFFEESEVKITRIMDLIHINTRMNSDSDFVMKEHCGGIRISAGINNRTFSYDKKY